MLKKITITFLVLVILLSVSLFFYGWYLSTHIEQRFSARRWSVPSRVYSDTTLLYPGQRINPIHLKDKLSALNYRIVPRQPAQKGELQISPDAITIFPYRTAIHSRRWSVPSRVYSDTTLLYPGQRINPIHLKDKLSALNYRRSYPANRPKKGNCKSHRMPSPYFLTT